MRLKVWGNLFQEEKISAKTQGMIKRNHEIFWGFPKSGEEILKIYFTSNFFFFSRENIFQEISSQILENPKNFMISFSFSPEF